MAVCIYSGPVPPPVRRRQLRDLQFWQLFWPVPPFASGTRGALRGALVPAELRSAFRLRIAICFCFLHKHTVLLSKQPGGRTGGRTGVTQGGHTGAREPVGALGGALWRRTGGRTVAAPGGALAGALGAHWYEMSLVRTQG